MKRRVGLIWLVACCALAAGLELLRGEPRFVDGKQVAREYIQRSWQHEHGLPMNRVWSILQTRDGYLWVGTQRGLARFDGVRFTVFDHVNTPELVEDDCHALAEDREGRLWISTRNHVFIKERDRFRRLDRGPDLEPLDFPPLTPSQQGGMWVGGLTRITLFGSGAGNDIAKLRTVETSPGQDRVLAEEGPTVWIGRYRGLNHVDLITGTNRPIAIEPEFTRLALVGMWRAPAGRRWVLLGEEEPRPPATQSCAWLGVAKDGSWQPERDLDQNIIVADPRSRFLVGDATGTLWLPAAANHIHRYRHGQLERLALPSESTDCFVLCAHIDREGNLWLGTESHGLQRWTPRRVANYAAAEGLIQENVWTITQSADGAVWIGTDGGVSRFSNGSLETIRRLDGSLHREVRGIVQTSDGSLWIGSRTGLECWKPGESQPVQLPGEWYETKIRVLHPGRDGSLWIGTVRGLSRLKDGILAKFTQADGLGASEVRAVAEDSAGRLWVGTLGGGLSCRERGAFTTFTTTNGLANNNVWALIPDPDGTLWIGTEGGLSRFKDGRLHSFTRREGLPDNLVNCLLQDELGRLWVGHDRGIYVVEKGELEQVALHGGTLQHVISFDDSDGLLSIETNGQKSNPAACRTRDGRLWFPTTKGVAVIDPATATANAVTPLPVIQECRSNGKVVFGDDPNALPRPTAIHPAQAARPGLQLPPGSGRVIEFRYTGNTFVAPEKVRFRHRLKGLEDSWTEAGARREAYFTAIHPGSYEFEVQACNHHGVWQERGATLAFYVQPYFFETWWFEALLVATAAVLVMAGIRWRLHEARKTSELQRLSALNEQRRRIARDIHDELGASLTHILRLADQARPETGARSNGNSPTQRITTIAGQAVDSINEIVWANNPEYDTLEDLVAYLREYAANFLTESALEVRFEFPERVPSRPVSGWLRRHIVLVLKEALQNVAKHAGASEVRLALTLQAEGLTLSVTDNGRGFAPTDLRPRNNGLKYMRQRIGELHGSIQIHSQPGAGTTVQVTIPFDEPG
jgi:ligand-binding sensor domain-containing protein/signal transduction histidine kinase